MKKTSPKYFSVLENDKELQIMDAFGSLTPERLEYHLLKSTYDGNNYTEMTNCYRSDKMEKTAFAVFWFLIQEVAEVNHVKFLPWRQGKNELDL